MLHAQLVNVGKELDDLRCRSASAGAVYEALHAQLVSVGKERDDLRELGSRAGLLETQCVAMEYFATRYRWQNLAICREHYGPPDPQPKPVAKMPPELRDGYTLRGRVPVEAAYMDETYPANWPLIYRDEEIDNYISLIKGGRTSIYGMVDAWVQEAFRRYPIQNLDVVTMGSRAPWYEAMIIAHGGRAATIDTIGLSAIHRGSRAGQRRSGTLTRCPSIMRCRFPRSSMMGSGLMAIPSIPRATSRR